MIASLRCGDCTCLRGVSGQTVAPSPFPGPSQAQARGSHTCHLDRRRAAPEWRDLVLEVEVKSWGPGFRNFALQSRYCRRSFCAFGSLGYRNSASQSCYRPRFSRKARKLVGARGRGRTGTALRRRDFKSRVSTNFTTRAWARSLTSPPGVCECCLRHTFGKWLPENVDIAAPRPHNPIDTRDANIKTICV